MWVPCSCVCNIHCARGFCVQCVFGNLCAVWLWVFVCSVLRPRVCPVLVGAVWLDIFFVTIRTSRHADVP